MFDKRAIKHNFSRAASSYDAHAKLQKAVQKKAMELTKSYFPVKATILDLGCGTGTFKAGKNEWDIIGADISYGMCEAAREKNQLVINADAEALPLADESMDCVFSSLLLQWAEKPEIVIKEILRVLKLSGTAIITTFIDGTLGELREAFAELDSAPHVTSFFDTTQILLRVAHNGGFTVKFDEKSHIEEYDDIRTLMRSIKNIGASNKISGRNKGMMTPSQLKKVEQAYKTRDGKFIVTWNVLTIVIAKL